MPVVSGALAATIQITGVTTGKVQNVAIALANTEVTHTLPTNTKRFFIKLRPPSAGTLKISYDVGTSGTEYLTVMPGMAYEEAGITTGSVTLYFQSTIASQVAEIVSWT